MCPKSGPQWALILILSTSWLWSSQGPPLILTLADNVLYGLTLCLTMAWLIDPLGPASCPHWSWQCSSRVPDYGPPYGLILVLILSWLSSSIEPVFMLTRICLSSSVSPHVFLTVPWVCSSLGPETGLFKAWIWSSLYLSLVLSTAWLFASLRPDTLPHWAGPDSIAQWALPLVLSMVWLFASQWANSNSPNGLILFLSMACFIHSYGLTLSSLGPELGPHWVLTWVLTRPWVWSLLWPYSGPYGSLYSSH